MAYHTQRLSSPALPTDIFQQIWPLCDFLLNFDFPVAWDSPAKQVIKGGWDGKESAYSAGVPGSIPESGGSPGGGVTAHSSPLAWRTPWTEEPGGLQSMVSQKVGRDWATHTFHFDNTVFLFSSLQIRVHWLGMTITLKICALVTLSDIDRYDHMF